MGALLIYVGIEDSVTVEIVGERCAVMVGVAGEVGHTFIVQHVLIDKHLPEQPQAPRMKRRRRHLP